MPEYEMTFRKKASNGTKTALTEYLQTEGYRDISFQLREDKLSAVFTTDVPLADKVFSNVRTSHHAIGLKRLK